MYSDILRRLTHLILAKASKCKDVFIKNAFVSFTAAQVTKKTHNNTFLLILRERVRSFFPRRVSPDTVNIYCHAAKQYCLAAGDYEASHLYSKDRFPFDLLFT